MFAGATADVQDFADEAIFSRKVIEGGLWPTDVPRRGRGGVDVVEVVGQTLRTRVGRRWELIGHDEVVAPGPCPSATTSLPAAVQAS